MNGSESKMCSDPLTGNPSELLRHYVVTIRCKRWISDIRDEGASALFTKKAFKCVLKFPSNIQCELKTLPFTNVARVRFLRVSVPGQGTECM